MNVLGAFPARPLAMNRVGASRFSALLCIVICLALAGGVAWWQGGDLWRDYQISRRYEVAADASISDARCRTYKIVMTDCSAAITDADGTRTHVSMIFVDLNFGGYETGVVRSLDNPKLLTLELGVENIDDRILTFACFIGLFVVAAIAAFISLLKTSALKRAVSVPTVMQPMVVDVLSQTRTLLNKVVKYRYHLDGKTREASALLRKNEDLFFLGDGQKQVLAVLPAAASKPILLDQRLEMLDLTDQERAALRGEAFPSSSFDFVPNRADRW